MKKKIIIVGGGAAALSAAEQLAEICEVIVIEAREMPGGRIRSHALEHGEGVIEEGAEFIHGKLPITERLINEARLTKVKVEGTMFRKEGKKWEPQEDMIEGWEQLLEKMKEQPYSKTMRQFINENYPAERHAALRSHIISFVQGFDVAAVDRVSVRSLYEEWSAEEDQYRLKEGYSALIRHLHQKLINAGCVFKFNTSVATVEWAHNKVAVTTAAGERIQGNIALITIPVSQFGKEGAMAFSPLINDHIMRFSQIGFGSVVKVIFDFKQQIWQPGTGFVFTGQRIPTWWTQYPLENNLLTGWAGGPDAASLYDLDDDQLLMIGLDSLAGVFDMTVDKLRTNIRQSYVFNWRKYPFCNGAYSFATPESLNARKILEKGIDDTIWFAGEGLVGGAYPGTVEAAFESGSRSANSIIASFS